MTENPDGRRPPVAGQSAARMRLLLLSTTKLTLRINRTQDGENRKDSLSEVFERSV